MAERLKESTYIKIRNLTLLRESKESLRRVQFSDLDARRDVISELLGGIMDLEQVLESELQQDLELT